MNKVKSLSQQNLSLLLAIYIGIFLNLSVFYRRFDSLAHGIQGIKLISAVTEVIAIVLFTFFIMRLVSLGGRLFYRIVASLLVLISVAASYYMTFFNVVIGYGIVVSVMSTCCCARSTPSSPPKYNLEVLYEYSSFYFLYRHSLRKPDGEGRASC